jgi:hypothetical protein
LYTRGDCVARRALVLQGLSREKSIFCAYDFALANARYFVSAGRAILIDLTIMTWLSSP